MHDVKFSLANIQLSGLTNGNVGKPLILALHGWLDNAASFSPLAKYLSDYQVIAIDFAGHGLSSHRSADAHYHQIDFVHDLHELVVTQGFKSFILLGHSMGGIVGSMYTSSFPEYVSHYITIESFGPLTKTAQSSPEQMRESIESRLQLQAREAKHPKSYDAVVKARAKAGDLSCEAAELLVNRNLYEQDGELRFRTDRRLRTISSLRVTDDQAQHFMQNIQCPTLAIMGTEGYEVMREKVKERLGWVQHLTHVTSPGGHHLHMDHPKQIAQHIESFLQNNSNGVE
ncbi:alpha/beta hydrolase [Aliiglaciecola sp. LCG003]|uniref:alpha/beta fold hydrolase n=1 Tax=Aliiglaciecola sp. LCG003 TaxID=3053655 RepID=UPI002572E860|nr:alpha/beta hydrolase [Aliiglaciecola sp. LCG003]WJG08207.1 alpha/beta hydrolase [Aliiglaciecola sp. LCG003]